MRLDRTLSVSVGATLGTLAVVGLATARGALGEEPRNFPYDPACAWGRIADGKGIMLRCLTEREVLQLQAPAPQAASAVAASAPAVQAAAQGAATSAPRPSGFERGTAASAEPKPPTSPANAPEPAGALRVEVEEAQAEQGQLPLARKKLAVPADRYLRCVQDHGGLSRESGEVQVRFLVRDRGRAEGASVGKVTGMSEQAARCIADVVDRRPVGIPEAEMVGASIVIRVTSRPAAGTAR